jgi:ankyrin repeat protein
MRRVPLVILWLLASLACSNTTSTSATTPGHNPEHDLPLIVAAGRGDLAEVERLLDLGASVSAVDPRGRTALTAAAYGAHLEVARALIAAGADVNVQDDTKQSAYLIATSEIGDSERALEFLRLMLGSGADVHSLDSYNGTGLIRAADRGFVEIVRELLRTPIVIDHVNRLGWTALLEAIILGRGDARRTEVVRLLVEAGANVNLADRAGVTPLQHASRGGYTEMVSILRAAGGR